MTDINTPLDAVLGIDPLEQESQQIVEKTPAAYKHSQLNVSLTPSIVSE